MKNNSICAICGKPYYTCNSCSEYKRLYPWKMYTDTSEHYKIFQIIHGYSIGVYDKTEIKDKLQNVDLSDLETLIDGIKNLIKDILEINNNQDTKTVVATNNTKANKNTKKIRKQSKK